MLEEEERRAILDVIAIFGAEDDLALATQPTGPATGKKGQTW
jgi:hypothetical protein